MGNHFDDNQDGVADSSEDDIGALENETIFIPGAEHKAPGEHAQMMMGRDHENDLRDPWFHTEEGKAWLAEHEDATAARKAGEG
jgi:hypothetical protein